MKRGEIWTVSGGKDYAGKPRPVVIIQDDRFDATDFITICPLTTAVTEAPLMRLMVVPNEQNGLRTTSSLMADKVTTVAKSKLGRRPGSLGVADAIGLDRMILVFLGLMTSHQAEAGH